MNLHWNPSLTCAIWSEKYGAVGSSRREDIIDNPEEISVRFDLDSSNEFYILRDCVCIRTPDLGVWKSDDVILQGTGMTQTGWDLAKITNIIYSQVYSAWACMVFDITHMV